MNGAVQEPPPSSGPVIETDPDDYRDHIPTADQRGKRRWVYPRKPSGTFYRYRTFVSWILLLVLFFGPFVRIGGNPLLMMNIVERKFSVFGILFWPQDFFLFALLMLIVFIAIALFTAVFGRIWCGWLCPQTVLMEMVFRKIEYWIDGDAGRQRILHAAPWTADKITRRVLKYAIFFGLSFVISNLLLAYIIGSDAWLALLADSPVLHPRGFTAMVLFSLLFFGIFARFREQACTFVCPYGRFQAVLLDDNSIVVAYDHKRGENRGRWNKKKTGEARSAEGLGDCIDCKMCVQVCPTGIDIRNGTQMECVNCTACIDACDSVMGKLQLPAGLIRYASFNNIERGERLRFTPRIAVYGVILCALTVLLAVLLVGRAPVDVSLLRAPGTLFQEQPRGDISNLYLLKVLNKTSRDIPVDLRLESHDGAIEIAGHSLVAEARGLADSSVVVAIPPDQLPQRRTPIRVGVYAEGEKLKTVKTVFLAPSPAVP